MLTSSVILVSVISLAVIAILLVQLIKKSQAYKKIYDEYKDIVDRDAVIAEKDKIISGKDAAISNLEGRINSLQEEHKEKSLNIQKEYDEKFKNLDTEYRAKRQVLKKLLDETQLVEEDLEFTNYGLYKPHYDFDTSEKYKAELEKVRAQQKSLIKADGAVICDTEWIVQGSKAKGKRQINQYTRLMLRAFNGECDAAVLKVRWNNLSRLVERLRRAHAAINKLGTVMNVEITLRYLDLKVEELRLTHEYEEKRHEEREEQKRIREQMREEERAQREIEKAQKDAEAEEKRREEALRKARTEVEKATGEKLSTANEKVAELERLLAEAKELKERALSRAQLTKSGYVYVISNVGSFGENVYKIGMTRRLEPMDRVKELGDASVPFTFDVHAMIYSEDAPGLENAMQKKFDNKRLNLINSRKEFFHVSLDEIEEVVTANHGEIEFTKLAEAREYRETQALLSEMNKTEDETKDGVEEQLAEFPETLL